jgi:hypothetical protein
VAPAANDGAKKMYGRKRHLLVDTLRLVLLVMITAANVPDPSLRCAKCGQPRHPGCALCVIEGIGRESLIAPPDLNREKLSLSRRKW